MRANYSFDNYMLKDSTENIYIISLARHRKPELEKHRSVNILIYCTPLTALFGWSLGI